MMITSEKATQKAMTNLSRPVHHTSSCSTTSSAALIGGRVWSLQGTRQLPGALHQESTSCTKGPFWSEPFESYSAPKGTSALS